MGDPSTRLTLNVRLPNEETMYTALRYCLSSLVDGSRHSNIPGRKAEKPLPPEGTSIVKALC